MRAGLLISGVAIVLAVLTPAVRGLRVRRNSRTRNEEYFAAARERAIRYRLAKSRPITGDGDG